MSLLTASGPIPSPPSYANLPWGDKELDALGAVLPFCPNLDCLDLSYNGVINIEEEELQGSDGSRSQGGRSQIGRNQCSGDEGGSGGEGGNGEGGGDEGGRGEGSGGEGDDDRTPPPRQVGFTRLPAAFCFASTLRTLFLVDCVKLVRRSSI